MNRHLLQLYKDKLKTLLNKNKGSEKKKKKEKKTMWKPKHLLYLKVNELTSDQ